MGQPSTTFTRYPPHDTRIQANRETIATCRDTVKGNPNEMAGKERNVRQTPMRSHPAPLAIRQSYPSLLIDLVRPFRNSCSLSSFPRKPALTRPALSFSKGRRITPYPDTVSESSQKSSVHPDMTSVIPAFAGIQSDAIPPTTPCPMSVSSTRRVLPHPKQVVLSSIYLPTAHTTYITSPTVKNPSFQSSQSNFQELS